MITKPLLTGDNKEKEVITVTLPQSKLRGVSYRKQSSKTMNYLKLRKFNNRCRV